MRISVVKMWMATGAAIVLCGSQSIKNTNIQSPRKGAAITIGTQLNFRFDQARVWQVLTTVEGIQALTGFAIEEPDQGKVFERKGFEQVGDAMPAKWGERKGRLVVTTFEKGREIRMVFEADDPERLSSRRFELATAGNGCVLRYWVQYTDFAEKSEDVDVAAKEMTEQIEKAAVAFRKVAEPKPRPRSQE